MLLYSERVLSEALGVSERQLAKWEIGLNRVGAKPLKDISEFLQELRSAFFEDFKADRMSAGHRSSLSLPEHLLEKPSMAHAMAGLESRRSFLAARAVNGALAI